MHCQWVQAQLKDHNDGSMALKPGEFQSVLRLGEELKRVAGDLADLRALQAELWESKKSRTAEASAGVPEEQSLEFRLIGMWKSHHQRMQLLISSRRLHEHL